MAVTTETRDVVILIRETLESVIDPLTYIRRCQTDSPQVPLFVCSYASLCFVLRSLGSYRYMLWKPPQFRTARCIFSVLIGKWFSKTIYRNIQTNFNTCFHWRMICPWWLLTFFFFFLCTIFSAEVYPVGDINGYFRRRWPFVVYCWLYCWLFSAT